MTVENFEALDTDYIAHLNELVEAVNDTVDAMEAIEAGGVFVGTSTTSTSIATGSKSFTVVELDRAWAVGAVVRASVTASPSTNYLIGTITAYSGTSLTLTVTTAEGSGTHAAWTIGLEGATSFIGGNLASGLNEAKFADLASASTVALGAAAGNYGDITGTTTITAFDTIQEGTQRSVRFTGILTLTHHATSLILPGGANITTAAGDVATFRSLGSGNWRCVAYTKADGTALVASSAQISTRQTVLSGAATNGVADYITAGSGLVANIAATTTPIAISFAAGYGSAGAVDYAGYISADTQITGLTDASTNYLYADYSAGTVTLGKTTLAPIYQWGGTASTTNLQHTYLVDKAKMYVGNGSTATAVNRVFLGEAVTAGGVVSSTVTYALRGQYVSAQVAMTGNSASTSFSAAIGTELGLVTGLEAICTTTDGNWSVGDICCGMLAYNSNGSSTFYMAHPISTTARANSIRVSSGASGFIALNKTTFGAHPPDPAKWNFRLTAKRGW